MKKQLSFMDLFLCLLPIILGVGKKDGGPGHIWGFKPPAQYNLVSAVSSIAGTFYYLENATKTKFKES